MTVLRHDEIVGTVTNDTLARVGYHNLFREGVVSVSSQDSAYPKEQAYNGLTYDAFRTSGAATEWIRVTTVTQVANYMAIFGHTLAGCTITPQTSLDGGVSWSDILTEYVVPDNRPIIFEWSDLSRAEWRLLIENASGPVEIAAIHVGRKTELLKGIPLGWAPPDLNEDVAYTNPISQGGQTLGRSVIRRGVKSRIKTEHVTYTWAKDTWLAFIEAARSYAVFFWWSYEGHAEIIYGGVEDGEAQFSQNNSVTTSFSIIGSNRGD